MSTPTHERCHLWRSLSTKDDLIRSLTLVKVYRDEYHNTRELLKCQDCGQLYFSEFYEVPDFRDGEDSQYYSFIPADTEARADELNLLSRFQLTALTGIFIVHPPYDAQPFWKNRPGH